MFTDERKGPMSWRSFDNLDGVTVQFKNPANGYIENSSVPALWCFLFGGIYFLVKGVFRHFFLFFLFAVCTIGISLFVYPFFAKSILRAHYGRMGWQEVTEA